MTYPLVRELAAEGIPVRLTCGVLGFSSQAFYKWRARPRSDRDRLDAQLTNAIVDPHDDDPEFGYRFIADELAAAGHRAGERRVWRLCRQQGIWSTTTKKGRQNRKSPGPAVHDDLVQRDFTAPARDVVWLTDITEHPTVEGKLYCCAIKDVFSNRIVGYALDERMTAALAVAALRSAIARRQPRLNDSSATCRRRTSASVPAGWSCSCGRGRGSVSDAPRAALADLEEIAKRVGGELLRASARCAQGVMLSAEGDHDGARRSLQDAVGLYTRSRVPHEAARARLELARSLLATGRIEQAVKEARSASDTFEHLGASLDLQRANRILDEAGREGDPAASPSASGSDMLTPRERDVLLLLAEGLSNPEIALRLVVSEHTVHRYVANVLTKLDVSSRAAAVAQAARRGFV